MTAQSSLAGEGRKDRHLLFPVLQDRVYLANSNTPKNEYQNDCVFFTIEDDLTYVPFCDDFGPLNLACVLNFIQDLKKNLAEHKGTKVVYQVQNTPRKLTNAVFLLGTFIIMTEREKPEDTWNRFRPLEKRIEMYRDATYSEADFRLTILDCWRGLARANQLGWINTYDLDEYSHYDNPLEGDLHVMVPGKLIAFKGPRTVPEPHTFMDERGCRHFAPSFYIEPFADMGVSTVVRLNEAEYDPSEFEEHGIQCLDLEFPDCTAPPQHITIEFLYTVDRAAGAVAVHCKAGLGRTGTLIAVYMMRSHGFTAREAMGWLRVVRPGAVIGEQQHFLCSLDAPTLHAPALTTPADPSPSEPEARWRCDEGGARPPCANGCAKPPAGDHTAAAKDGDAAPGGVPPCGQCPAPPPASATDSSGCDRGFDAMWRQPMGSAGLELDVEALAAASRSGVSPADVLAPRGPAAAGPGVGGAGGKGVGDSDKLATQVAAALQCPERTAVRAWAARRQSG